MRLGTLLLALFLLPFVVAQPASAGLTNTATYAGTTACVAGGAYQAGVGIAIPGCTVSTAGTVTATSCDATHCTLAVASTVTGAGLLPGLQTAGIRAASSYCSSQGLSFDGAFACGGATTFTFDVPSGCRFLVLESTLVTDVKVAGADVTNVFRVCTTGTVQQIQ